MVGKNEKQNSATGRKGKIKVLNLNKETIKHLTDDEARDVKGGTSVCISGSGRCGQSTGSVIRQTSVVQNSTSAAGNSTSVAGNSGGGFNP